jgi:hypothetical protein
MLIASLLKICKIYKDNIHLTLFVKYIYSN